MEVKYLGGQSFLIKGREATVLTAPFKAKKVVADVVLSSTPLSRGESFLVPGPGEYEIKGVKVQGLSDGGGTLYLLEMERVFVGFLGGLTQPLSDEELSGLGVVDILIIPTSAGENLGPAKLAGIVTQLEPRIVIPIKTDGTSLGTFLKELGEEPKHEKMLRVSKEKLPEELEVVVMERV